MDVSDMMLLLAWLVSGLLFANVKFVFVRVLCIVVALVAPVIWLAEEIPAHWVFWYAAIAVIVITFGVFKYLMSVAYKGNKNKH